MHIDDFRRLFVGFVMVDTLVAMRWLDRKWHKVVEKKLIGLENEPCGEIIVHGGNDVSYQVAWYDYERKERMKQVMKVVFLLNITKVGCYACFWAVNLVDVDIPEGITIIGEWCFYSCSDLKDIKFPKSLTSISNYSFRQCSSLEKVELLHTSVRYLGEQAFGDCTSLREIKVPDSLQKCNDFNGGVFMGCSKLVPSDVDVSDSKAVVAYLRSIQ
ncbi:hypothetical protein TrVE_jg980 [Triparma verrucosa]|uniref:Uncharacterized protein n=1 Tax=Triparma verrucosa TaxID=1606542 RepID=A0A9W7FPY2_9STRA|nr:hypothetical protein TrVE_jg980 [Triparma verrucosa]